MKEIWQAILKFLLSKTKLDEKLADKLDDLKEKVDTIDKIDGDTEVKQDVTPKTEEQL
jgi:hypothetical protein